MSVKAKMRIIGRPVFPLNHFGVSPISDNTEKTRDPFIREPSYYQRVLRFLHNSLILSTVNILLIYRFYTGQEIICFVISVTYELPINAASVL